MEADNESGTSFDESDNIEPTCFAFRGYVTTKEYARHLVYESIRGAIPICQPRPGQRHHFVQCGNVMISTVPWHDGIVWIREYIEDGCWVSFPRDTPNAIRKKSVEFEVDGLVYHITCYFNPWDTHNLLEALEAFPGASLRFMRYSQLLCLMFADTSIYTDILLRGQVCWYPKCQTTESYWENLATNPVFWNVEKRDLKRQAHQLLLALFQLSSHRRLDLNFSAHFSPLQNRTLIYETFQINSSPQMWTCKSPKQLYQDFVRSRLHNDNVLSLRGPRKICGYLEYLPLWLLKYDLELSSTFRALLNRILYCSSFVDSRRILDHVHVCRSLFQSQNQDILVIAILSARPMSTTLSDFLLGHGDMLYNRLIGDLQGPSTLSVLVLALAGLLLLSQTMGGLDQNPDQQLPSMENFDRLQKKEMQITKIYEILKCIQCNFAKHLSTRGGLENTALLTILTDIEPISGDFPLDEVRDAYWKTRIEEGISHTAALAKISSISVAPSTNISTQEVDCTAIVSISSDLSES